MEQDVKTVGLMIDLYCRGQHGGKDNLCGECRELLAYVKKRLEKCPFQENKPTCSQCTVHCYQPAMREKIKAVMKYAGPRMLFCHPVLSGKHYLTRKKA